MFSFRNINLKSGFTPLKIRRQRRLTVADGNLSLTGFTLVETLLVISIIGIITSAAVLTFTDQKKQALLEDAQATIINALEEARSKAATGVGVGHENYGVRTEVIGVDKINVISFKGEDCDPGNSTTLSTTTLSGISADPACVTFNRLSAISSENTTTTFEITNTNTNATETVEVTKEGIISSQ